MNIDEKSKFKSSRHVYARDFEGDLVLLDLAQGHYYGLEEIGARLWSGLMLGRTVAEVAAELSPEYDVEPAQLKADLLDLLRDLAEKGLVEPVAE
jgi:hypothetical protein